MKNQTVPITARHFPTRHWQNRQCDNAGRQCKERSPGAGGASLSGSNATPPNSSCFHLLAAAFNVGNKNFFERHVLDTLDPCAAALISVGKTWNELIRSRDG